jgi:hypothetical protein
MDIHRTCLEKDRTLVVVLVRRAFASLTFWGWLTDGTDAHRTCLEKDRTLVVVLVRRVFASLTFWGWLTDCTDAHRFYSVQICAICEKFFARLQNKCNIISFKNQKTLLLLSVNKLKAYGALYKSKISGLEFTHLFGREGIR